MAYIKGQDCKAYFSSTALTNTTYATGLSAATLINNIIDLETSLAADKADTSTRGSGGWKTSMVTLKDGTVTFKMMWDTGDAAFTAFKTAFLAGSEIAFAAMDGLKATTGAQGIAGNFYVSSFKRVEPLTGPLQVDVELVPSSYIGWWTV